MKRVFREFIFEDRGQDLIEYAVIMAVLAILVVGVAVGARAGVFHSAVPSPQRGAARHVSAS